MTNFGHAQTPFPPAAAPAVVRPRRPGWWQRNWKWAVPAAVILTIAGFIAFIAMLVAFIFGMLRSTEVYQTAMSEALTEPAVIAALGAPIEEGFLVVGNVEINPSSGHADLAIPIAGPDGTATVYVEAEKARGEWAYATLEVSVHATGETIDLLADW